MYIPLEDDRLVALSRRTGEIVWTAPLAARARPLVDGESLFITDSANIVELACASGMTTRRLALPAVPHGPLIATTDLLLTAAGSHQVVAVNRADGAIAWQVTLDTAPVGLAADASRRVAYVSLANGHVTALSLDDGATRWRTRRPLGMRLTAPVPAGRRVVIGSDAHAVVALGSGDGGEVWVWPTGGDVIGVAASPDTVYAVSLDNVLWALHLESGNQRWHALLPTRPVAAPLVHGSSVIVTGVRPRLAVYAATGGKPLDTFDAVEGLELAVLEHAPLIAPDGHQEGTAGLVLVFRDGSVVGLTAGSAAKEARIFDFRFSIGD